MGCGCQKFQVGAAPVSPAGATRTFVVEQDRVREVTGIALPQDHSRALAQARERSYTAQEDWLRERHEAIEMTHPIHSGQAASDPLQDAQNGSLLPSLAFGGIAGLVLGKTLLASTVGFPVALALAALGMAAFNAGKTIPLGCSCVGGGCATYEGGPSCTQANMQPCIDACTQNGTVVGGAAGLGVGLLLELWSRRFPVPRFFF